MPNGKGAMQERRMARRFAAVAVDALAFGARAQDAARPLVTAFMASRRGSRPAGVRRTMTIKLRFAPASRGTALLSVSRGLYSYSRVVAGLTMPRLPIP
jgi:hypothetical protein